MSASFFAPMPFRPRIRPSLAGTFEIVERPDFEPAVQQRHGLGADALKVEQIEDRRRELLQEFLVIATGAGLDQLRQLAGEIFADAGNAESVLLRQRR